MQFDRHVVNTRAILQMEVGDLDRIDCGKDYTDKGSICWKILPLKYKSSSNRI